MHDSKSNKKFIHDSLHRYQNHFLNGGKHTDNTSMKILHKLFCIYCTLLLLHTEQWKRFWCLRKQDAKCINWNWYKTYRCKIHCWHNMHRVASVPLLIMYSLLFPKIGSYFSRWLYYIALNMHTLRMKRYHAMCIQFIDVDIVKKRNSSKKKWENS